MGDVFVKYRWVFTFVSRAAASGPSEGREEGGCPTSSVLAAEMIGRWEPGRVLGAGAWHGPQRCPTLGAAETDLPHGPGGFSCSVNL